MIHEGTKNWTIENWIEFRAEYFEDYFAQKDASRGFDITEARREGDAIDIDREERYKSYMREAEALGKAESIKRFNDIFGEAIYKYNKSKQI